MTSRQKIEAIKTLCSTNIPALLIAAGLEPVDVYRSGTPLRQDDREVCVYLESESEEVESETFSALIMFQNYETDDVELYHSVFFDYLKSSLTGDIVDMDQRVSILADVWPLDINSSNSFIYYIVKFQTWLDNC